MRAPRGEHRWRESALLFVLAVALRLAAVGVLDSPRAAESGEAWTWGQETVCMAQSLVEGRPFGDPWRAETGPSAWLTPIFPLYVATCIALGQGIGRPAAWLLHTGQALVSASICLLLLALGRRLGAPRAGRLAAWTFAFLPAAIWNAAHTVWDTTWSAAALTAYFLLSLAPRARPLREGLVFGFLGLLNPALWGILPAALWHLVRRAGCAGPGRRLTLFGLGALLVSGPWMVRNQLQIGSAGLRSNLGVELRVGNNDQAYGRHETAYHPSHTPSELERYRALGEREYVRVAGREALAWIADHPRRFALLCAIRARLFWLGETPAQDPRVDERVGRAEEARAWIKWGAHSLVGVLGLVAVLRLRTADSRGTFLRWSVLLFPVPYYLTHVAERYRFPIEPLLLLLACWLLSREPLREADTSEGIRSRG